MVLGSIEDLESVLHPRMQDATILAKGSIFVNQLSVPGHKPAKVDRIEVFKMLSGRCLVRWVNTNGTRGSTRG